MADRQLTDPLWREISLHERTWVGHIIRGHPELAEYRHYVERAITAPMEIRESNSDPKCRLYYGIGPRETVQMMVVVDLSLGIVKTAHWARTITGGKVEWSLQTR